MLSSLLLLSALASPTPCSSDCIFGSVRFVDSAAAADYSIRWVSGAADMRVRFVSGPARQPGEWQLTNTFADYAIYQASSSEFADLLVTEVSAFPGCN